MNATTSDHQPGHPVGAEGLVALLRRRVDGTFEVDEWGLDPDLVALVEPVIGLRWQVSVEGGRNLPGSGPVMVVYNRRAGLSEPFVVARAVRAATGRHARPVGSPDIAPVGTLLRRLGGVLDQAAEVAGLLRAGQIVAVPLGRQLWSRHRAGSLPADRFAAAAGEGAVIVPCAVIGHESGRRWRVVFGPPVEPAVARSGAPDAAGAETAARRVGDLLDAST